MVQVNLSLRLNAWCFTAVANVNQHDGPHGAAEMYPQIAYSMPPAFTASFANDDLAQGGDVVARNYHVHDDANRLLSLRKFLLTTL